MRWALEPPCGFNPFDFWNGTFGSISLKECVLLITKHRQIQQWNHLLNCLGESVVFANEFGFGGLAAVSGSLWDLFYRGFYSFLILYQRLTLLYINFGQIHFS